MKRTVLGKGGVGKSGGGERGIRTLGAAINDTHDFQSCSFSQLGHLSASNKQQSIVLVTVRSGLPVAPEPEKPLLAERVAFNPTIQPNCTSNIDILRYVFGIV
jgi:hypothetical protein